MPCSNCNRCVIKDNIAYCKCGNCNICHIGYVCPNEKTLWSERCNPIVQADFIIGQSNRCSRTPLPSCSCKLCFKDRFVKIINNEIHLFSHCGDKCRFEKCKH